MANSDIIKIGFDYRASLEQFEKETNGVFDGISNKAGKQKITIQLDAKDDKVIDKIKELQKLKLDKFTFEFGDSGLKEQLQTFDKLENKINEIISLSKGIDLSFNTKNKTEAYNQLKKYADAFKEYYGNEEAMATNAGAKAGYAYYKAYEEALRKGVAQSKLEKVTVDFDVNDSIFSKERIVENRIKEFENFQKYGNADESNLIAEITLLENRLLKFNSAYSQVKANLGNAPITPEITKNIEEYVRLLEIAESRAKDAELFGYPSEDINSDKDLANMYLDFAKEDATAENKKYIESLKQEETQAIATAEAEQKLAEAQNETVSNTSNSNNSQIEELKSDIQEVKTELGDVKDRISSIESNGFENVRDDVEKTKESVKELNSELAEMKSNLSSTPQESNISLTSDSTVEQQIKSESELNSEIEKRENIIRELQQLQEKLTVHEDFHGNDRYFADQLPTEEEIREADKRIKQLTGTNNIFNVDKLIQDRNKWLSEVKYSLEEYDDLIKANDQKALDEYTTRGLSRIGGAESFFGYEDNNFSIASKFVEEKEKIQNEINDLYTDLDKLDEKMNLDSNNSSVDNTVQSQEKLQSELKETQKQAEKTAQAVKESTTTASTGQKKDAFPSTEATASVEKTTQAIKEENNALEETANKAKQAVSELVKGRDIVSQNWYREKGTVVGKDSKGNDITRDADEFSFVERLKNGQLQTVLATYDEETGKWAEQVINVKTAFEQVEKAIISADNKIASLQMSRDKILAAHSGYDTTADDNQIAIERKKRDELQNTLNLYGQEKEYVFDIEAANKRIADNQERLNNKKQSQTNLRQTVSEEQNNKREATRQKSIEQTNRLLNKQQIIIDGIEKSYSKAANNDLDKAVNSQSDLTELANKKAQIQTLLNTLKGKDRNSSNEKEFLQVEKLIAEYKQLAKDKLKANNPSKQELGGQELDVLLANQVTQYNKLISQSEKYGDATKDITNELKVQRDLIAEQDKNGVYVTRSKKADGSEITANDYYNARDNYKIDKSIFSSYETAKKEASELQAIVEAKKKSRQLDKETTQASVDNALKDQLTAWKNIQSIREKINNTSDTHEIEVLKQVKSEYQQNYIEADKILKANSDLYDKETQLAKLEQIRIEANNKIASSQDKQISSYENKLSTYQNKKAGYDATIARFNDGGWTSSAYLENVQAVKDAVKKYEDLLSNIKAKGGIASEEDIQNLKEYESEIKDTIATVTNMSASEKGYNFVSAQKELDKIHKLLNENNKMSSEAKAKIQAYYREIESGNPSMSLDRIHGEIMKIYNAEVEAGRAGKTMWSIIKNSGLHQIAAQMAGMFGVYDVINLGKQAFSTVKELDYALVDLKKTTAMNSSELEQFYYDSNDVAKQMGVTTKEIIDQASSWSRLGYNSKQAATEMAKLSSQFALISPGMDTTTSQEGLVSIMKAWDIGYQDVKSQIMDDINALGNAMAEDNQDIVEGMERSAAALAAVGTSTKDAFALFSGIQEVLQNSEKSGTSLRSVALRLRSFDETTGEYSEDLANITGELADLTKTAEHAQGVSVFKPGSTTEFKSLVDYFREIADIWDEMSQKQQNDFLLKAFGRTQAQAGAALIQNFKGVEKALDVMDDAAGSADKEMETAKQSITYKLNELKQTWVGTVQDIANRDDLGKIVDGLTDLSSAIGFVIDKLGLVGTVGLFGGAGTGIFKFIKNFDWVFKPYTKNSLQQFLVGQS